MNCWKENCKLCKKENLWYYIFRMPFSESMNHVRWGEMVWLIVSYSISMYFLGWFLGFIVAWIFTWSFADFEGGAVADIWNEYPPEEYPENTCSAGIEGCKICNNEYSHEFNKKYDESLKWWEKII